MTHGKYPLWVELAGDSPPSTEKGKEVGSMKTITKLVQALTELVRAIADLIRLLNSL